MIKRKVTQNVIYRISLYEKLRKTKFFKIYLFQKFISSVETFIYANNLRIGYIIFRIRVITFSYYYLF